MDFYAGLIEWTVGDTSFLTNVWAEGSHMGEAVHRMMNAAKSNEIEHATLLELDYCDLDDIPEEAIAVDGGRAFIDSTEHSFPTEYSYKFPHGVVPVMGDENETDVDKIKPGYEIWEDDDGLTTVEAVVEREQLFDIYLQLVEVLPEVAVFWIKLQEDWEEFDSDERYVCEELTTASGIRDFLEETWTDTVLNGYVTLTTYCDEGQTNLNISDHKTLVVMTYDPEIAKLVCAHLKKVGLPEHSVLLSVAGGVHHWHYRHCDGKDRKDFIRLLTEKGFKLRIPESDAVSAEEAVT